MDETEQFIKLVDSICRRPKMYTVNGTFGEVAALFTGIQIASSDSPIADDNKRTLNLFVNARLLVPDKYGWAGAIRLVCDDDETAITRLRELLVEYAKLRQTKSLNEIRKLAAQIRDTHVEPEQAKVWRQSLPLATRQIEH
ncbi:hypothetical protein [Algisphaera agarilytica]|uniref:Uncharacterized protein n=1 Tax=Algisphaera agarilytica TaxID=1385975 RepID=A0A7X0H8S8_9BACT|nr:hypothetical protein [Algisphaera agarilytica]MBB6430191.1 hypothetical protein [Algisphaera agarilytica]